MQTLRSDLVNDYIDAYNTYTELIKVQKSTADEFLQTQKELDSVNQDISELHSKEKNLEESINSEQEVVRGIQEKIREYDDKVEKASRDLHSSEMQYRVDMGKNPDLQKRIEKISKIESDIGELEDQDIIIDNSKISEYVQTMRKSKSGEIANVSNNSSKLKSFIERNSSRLDHIVNKIKATSSSEVYKKIQMKIWSAFSKNVMVYYCRILNIINSYPMAKLENGLSQLYLDLFFLYFTWLLRMS